VIEAILQAGRGEDAGDARPMSPAEELGTLVGWATVLFFLAEEDHNPSVKTLWDAYHYVTTSLSVGYANIFPVTPMGKAIGAIVMTVGPALSSRALDTAKPNSAENSDGTALLAAKLDEVIAELKRLRPVV
jgi:hypothetical protein